ncbi:MAG TPA: hypothetical protein VL916_07830 [Ilumatobacteraceae bacterium]|nr:hypothetical protein [Ilumatobacteraceae bacterium]
MRRVLFGLLLAGAGLAFVSRADAQQPPDTTAPPPTSVPPEGGATEPESGVTGGGTEGEQTPATLPLVPVPEGCTAPPLPHIVFVGKVVDRDFRSARFEIEQVRAGQAAPFASENEIDVRYGLDVQYLDDGGRYLVSAPVDPDLGLLVSRVTPVIENFGGDEVIGVSESDVNCPAFENPLRTLHLDGTAVEASAIKPFFASRVRILGAVAVPIAVAAGVIFLLATFRLSIAGLYRSVVDTGRRAR